ncbi:hypothetical protein QCA50_013589 [Cerrena zonata]|uniref:Protein kinase domain-containing protein n=1 Tax=Cerrena zonata TaxID=2478898 RepID=A0AAW0FVH1_9APHY
MTMSNDIELGLVELTPYGYIDRDHHHRTDIFWRDHQAWLAEKGYIPRVHSQPDRTPLWTDKREACQNYWDGAISKRSDLIDAIRLSDGETVMMKTFSRDENPHEKEITTFLASEPAKSHPRNHSNVLYEVLDTPGKDMSLLVMPALDRFHEPGFDNIGEVLECLRQIFEGLQFLHNCGIAHRALTDRNIMMDSRKLRSRSYDDIPLVKNPFSRTPQAPRYYIIDFGLSRRYPFDNSHRLNICPEVKDDPFAMDVCCLGNVIQRRILETYTGCEFLQPLVDAMCDPDVQRRLTIKEVVEQYDQILHSRWWWQLRARV